MWVDVMTLEEAKNNPPEQIEPPKEIQCELRVIIWNTKKVNLGTQKNRDIMVIGYMEGQKPQSTDTHWRSENGEGMFNWRMKFPVTCKFLLNMKENYFIIYLFYFSIIMIIFYFS